MRLHRRCWERRCFLQARTGAIRLLKFLPMPYRAIPLLRCPRAGRSYFPETKSRGAFQNKHRKKISGENAFFSGFLLFYAKSQDCFRLYKSFFRVKLFLRISIFICAEIRQKGFFMAKQGNEASGTDAHQAA